MMTESGQDQKISILLTFPQDIHHNYEELGNINRYHG